MEHSYSGRRRFGVSRFNAKKPVELDKEYEAKISDASKRGDGSTKIGGFIIFVLNTKQGQHVRFKITNVGSRFAMGELLQS